MNKIIIPISLLILISLAAFVIAETKNDPEPLGPGATGCESGTTWDDDLEECVACATDENPYLDGGIWKCNSEPLGPGPTSCNEPHEIWDYQLKECVSTSSTTPGGSGINCPEACVCKGNAISCTSDSENQTVTAIVQGDINTSSSSETISGGTLSIGKTSSGISIKQGDVEAITTQKINVMESKLYLETSSGTKEVKILPEQISSKTSIQNIDEMKITEEDGKPVYSISGKKEGKLIFFLPVSTKITQKISAETGEIISTSKPWWSFLASGI